MLETLAVDIPVLDLPSVEVMNFEIDSNHYDRFNSSLFQAPLPGNVQPAQNTVNTQSNVAPNPVNPPTQPNLNINLQSVPSAPKAAYGIVLI